MTISGSPTPVGLLGLVALAAGCNSGVGPQSRQSMQFRVAAGPSAASAGVAAGPLVLAGVRLVLGPAALGKGDQFGCQDCTDSGPESTTPATLVLLPSDGTPVSLATEQVSPGRYGAAELELLPVERVQAAPPGWPVGTTMELTGTFRGAPFTLQLAVAGVFREQLNPPVDVSVTGSPAPSAVVITLPVSGWFSAGGAALDPNNPADRARITQNALASILPREAASAGR